MEFLRAAIAPRDFPGNSPQGIPDLFSGGTMTYRHQAVFTYKCKTGPSYFAFLPTPGVAYWLNDDVTTANTFNAQKFPDFSTVFGDNTKPDSAYGAINFESFRYLSMTVEVKNISPLLKSGGSINAARVPGLTFHTQAAANGTMARYVTGLSNLGSNSLSTMPSYYSGHVNDGVYGWAINEGNIFPFSEIWTNTVTAKDVDATPETMVGPLMGYGAMTPLGVSIEGSNADTSVQILVECVIEYTPRAGSMMAHIAVPSPSHDPLALITYSEAGRTMPAFVKASENAGFWQRLLGFISRAAPVVGGLFGPAGSSIGGLVGSASGWLSSVV
jgi:hypothetical protein